MLPHKSKRSHGSTGMACAGVTLSLTSRGLTDAKATTLLLQHPQRSSITSLDLSRNQIKATGLDLAALVPRLQQLDLSHNLIQRLPDCIVGLIQLQRINLECCQLQRLPVAIGGLPLLRVLQIKENRHMKWPPRAVLEKVTVLEFLKAKFAANQKESTDRAWEASIARVHEARLEERRARKHLENQLTSDKATPTDSPSQTPPLPPIEALGRKARRMKSADIEEVRTMIHPPQIARQCLEAVWMVLNARSDKPTWEQIQAMLANRNFKKDLHSFSDTTRVGDILKRDIRNQVWNGCMPRLDRVERTGSVCSLLWHWLCPALETSSDQRSEVVERQLDVLSTCGALVCAAKARSIRCVNVHNALAKQLGRDFVCGSPRTGDAMPTIHVPQALSLNFKCLRTKVPNFSRCDPVRDGSVR